MGAKPSEHDTFDAMEVSCMEHTRAQELIAQLKEVKKANEITYPRIMERIEATGKYISLTTLRRVFAEGSELNADCFNYENTLLPIADALLPIEDTPTIIDNPYAGEIAGLKAVIRTQAEEISHLYDLNQHLHKRITFLLEQIEIKDRRMDEKDETIRRLMDKLL